MSVDARHFTATIQAGRGGGAYVRVPFDVKAVLGSARPKVLATFDGVEYRGSIAPMGDVSVLGIVKAIRARIGKDVGDRVTVVVRLDTAERTVEIPPELASALRRHRGARKAFDALSYTRRREIAESVASAKKEETRLRRAAKAAAALGQHSPKPPTVP